MKRLLVALLLVSACNVTSPPTGPTVVTQTTTVTTTYPPPAAPTPTPVPTPTPNPTTGTRTPDPSPGTYLPLPSYGQSVLQSWASSAAGAAALAHNCASKVTEWVFLDGLVDMLRARDTRWGYACKRGDCGNPSTDNVSWHATAGPDVTGAAGVINVDVIGDLCGANAAQWLPGVFSPGDLWTTRGRF